MLFPLGNKLSIFLEMLSQWAHPEWLSRTSHSCPWSKTAAWDPASFSGSQDAWLQLSRAEESQPGLWSPGWFRAARCQVPSLYAPIGEATHVEPGWATVRPVLFPLLMPQVQYVCTVPKHYKKKEEIRTGIISRNESRWRISYRQYSSLLIYAVKFFWMFADIQY